jgi:hypothetical protein
LSAKGKKAVEVSEQYADRAADVTSLRAAGASACDKSDASEQRWYYVALATREATDESAPVAARETAGLVSVVADPDPANRELEDRVQADLLRDIFANPFRHTTLDPGWLIRNGGVVVKLAQGIYAERAFDRLPILADALEDAGCGDADILAHCRGGGEHVRGCWVVDLLLGKE